MTVSATPSVWTWNKPSGRSVRRTRGTRSTVAADQCPFWRLWNKRHTLVTPGSDPAVLDRYGGYTSRRDRRTAPATRKAAAYTTAPADPAHTPSRSLLELPRVPATVAANT